MELNGKPVDFVISGDGKLTVGGKPVTLLPSTDTSGNYPVGAGWKMFTYKGIRFYFLNRGGRVQLVPVAKPSGELSKLSAEANGIE